MSCSLGVDVRRIFLVFGKCYNAVTSVHAFIVYGLQVQGSPRDARL